MLDHDEEELIAEYERGADRAGQEAMEAARRCTRKALGSISDYRPPGLEMMKRRPAEEGLPYQSLIASILNKYVSRSAPHTN